MSCSLCGYGMLSNEKRKGYMMKKEKLIELMSSQKKETKSEGLTVEETYVGTSRLHKKF